MGWGYINNFSGTDGGVLITSGVQMELRYINHISGTDGVEV